MSNPYAQVSDLYVFGAPQTAFGAIPTSTLQSQLDAAAGKFDSAVGGRYAVPLQPLPPAVTVPAVVTQTVCQLATFPLLANSRGFNPMNPGDKAVMDSYIEAVNYTESLQHQRKHLVGVALVSSQPMPQPTVLSTSVVDVSTGASLPNRGW